MSVACKKGLLAALALGLILASGGCAVKEPTPTKTAVATATNLPEVPFGVDALQVGQDNKLDTMIYAMKLSSRQELNDMAEEYKLTGADFNLSSKFDDTFFKKNVVIVIITNAGGGIVFDVTSAHVVGKQLVLSLWQGGKLDDAKPTQGALAVSFNREDIESSEDAEIHITATVKQ